MSPKLNLHTNPDGTRSVFLQSDEGGTLDLRTLEKLDLQRNVISIRLMEASLALEEPVSNLVEQLYNQGKEICW